MLLLNEKHPHATNSNIIWTIKYILTVSYSCHAKYTCAKCESTVNSFYFVVYQFSFIFVGRIKL